VEPNLFVELSEGPTLFHEYFKIEINRSPAYCYVKPINNFDDSEFSDNDIELMDFVIKQYGNKTSKELVSITHRMNAPWYNSATRNGVYNVLVNELLSSTEFDVDLKELVEHDSRKKHIYLDYKSMF
jgi:uncharacterized phage-associated protein